MSLEFIRYRKDILVPVMLLAISLMVLAFNSMHSTAKQLNPFSRLLLAIMSYPQRVVNGAVDSVGNYWRRYADLRGAVEENDVLHKQLDSLQMRLQMLVEENARLSMGLNSSLWPGAEMLTAQIIAFSPQEEYRVITINEGATAGVRYGMPVVTGAGVVGKVIGSGGGNKVEPTSALVLLLLDPRCRVDAFVYRFNPAPPPIAPPEGSEGTEAPPPPDPESCPWDPVNWQQTRVRGVVQGSQDKLILKYVSREADIKPGDRVVSSGLGGIFPKGLLIGTVSRVDPPELDLSPYIEVSPAVNFERLEEVQVMIKKGAPAP